MDKEEKSAKVVSERVEIDRRAPFKSVKEAVLLFGERVLVREVYGNRLKEMHASASTEKGISKSRIGAITAELEETKQNLQKTRGEINSMSHSTRSLKEELEETKKELKRLKAKESQKQQPVVEVDDPEIEDLKFIETTTSTKIIPSKESIEEGADDDDVEKKRNGKFARPPSLLAQVIVSKERMIEGSFIHSAKKSKRKKPIIPLIGWLFSVKKGSAGDDQQVMMMKMNSPRNK